MANTSIEAMRCPVCDSPDHVHCSIGCARCDDEKNPHPTSSPSIFCNACRKSFCSRCYVLHLRGCTTADQLKPKLIAATLNRREYLRLRNTVRILRGAGISLDAEQEKQCKKFEAVVRAYEEVHPC